MEREDQNGQERKNETKQRQNQQGRTVVRIHIKAATLAPIATAPAVPPRAALLADFCIISLNVTSSFFGGGGGGGEDDDDDDDDDAIVYCGKGDGMEFEFEFELNGIFIFVIEWWDGVVAAVVTNQSIAKKTFVFLLLLLGRRADLITCLLVVVV